MTKLKLKVKYNKFFKINYNDIHIYMFVFENDLDVEKRVNINQYVLFYVL